MTKIDWTTADITRSESEGTLLTVNVEQLDAWAATHMVEEWRDVAIRDGRPATIAVAGEGLFNVTPQDLGTALANVVNHAIRHAENAADEWKIRADAYRARLTSWL